MVDQAPMSFFVDGSLDQISMTWPTWIVPIPFLASSNGPGQALPRASTTLALSRAARSVSLSGVVAVIIGVVSFVWLRPRRRPVRVAVSS